MGDSQGNPEILLVNPYSVATEVAPFADLDVYPPVGLHYLASYLTKAGHQVAILDGTFTTPEELLSEIRRMSAPLVGVTANLITRHQALRACEEAKHSGAVVVAGGPDPNTAPEEYFRVGVDAVVHHEGEESLLEYVTALRHAHSSDLPIIPGVSCKDSGTAFSPRPLIEDLGSLPWPDYSLVDVQRYLSFGKKHRGFSMLPILSARGCPFTCTWCSKPVFGDSIRSRPVREFVDELEQLISSYRPDRVRILDDAFTVGRSRVAEMADEVEKRRIQVEFECLTRADLLDPATVGHLKRMGCYRIWTGVESGSPTVLEAMNKGFSVDQVRAAAGWIHDAGIELACYVMVGYLGESFRDVGKTLALLDEIRPECLSVSVAYPLPGTEYYDLVEDRIFDATSWRHTNDYRVGYHRRYPDAYYRSARSLVLRHWERRAQLSGASVPRRIWGFLREAQARVTASALAVGRWA